MFQKLKKNILIKSDKDFVRFKFYVICSSVLVYAFLCSGIELVTDSTVITQQANQLSLTKDTVPVITVTPKRDNTGQISNTSVDYHKRAIYKCEFGIKTGSSSSRFREEDDESPMKHKPFSPISIYSSLLLSEKHALHLEAGVNDRNDFKYLTFACYQKFCNGWNVFQFFGYAGPKLDFLIDKETSDSKELSSFLISLQTGVGMQFLIKRVRIGSNIFFENALNKTKFYKADKGRHSWVMGEQLEIGMKFKSDKK